MTSSPPPLMSLDTGNIDEATAALPSLFQLNLHECSITPQQTKDFCNALIQNSTLIYISLFKAKLSATAMMMFVETLANCKNLKQFFFGRVRLSDQAFWCLANALRKNSMESLFCMTFHSVKINTKAVRWLMSALSCEGSTKLKSLYILNGKLSTPRMRYICDMLRVNRTLDTVDLSGSPMIGDESSLRMVQMVLENEHSAMSNLVLHKCGLTANGVAQILQLGENYSRGVVTQDTRHNTSGSLVVWVDGHLQQ